MDSAIGQHIRKFIELSEEEEAIVLAHTQHLQLKKKDSLLKEGQICKANYFVEKGCLRMFFINEKGTEQITQFAIENWWITDYMSLGIQKPSQFYIQAVEVSEVLAIDHIVQEKLLKELPKMERYFRIILQKAYAASQMRFKYFYGYSKEENYELFSSSFPEFIQRIPQYMLASYLDFTPEYLSELRKKKH